MGPINFNILKNKSISPSAPTAPIAIGGVCCSNLPITIGGAMGPIVKRTPVLQTYRLAKRIAKIDICKDITNILCKGSKT